MILKSRHYKANLDSSTIKYHCWVGDTTGSASDQQSTNDRKVAGSRPTKVVCITVLTSNRLGWTVLWPAAIPSSEL